MESRDCWSDVNDWTEVPFVKSRIHVESKDRGNSWSFWVDRRRTGCEKVPSVSSTKDTSLTGSEFNINPSCNKDLGSKDSLSIFRLIYNNRRAGQEVGVRTTNNVSENR